jgi:hypothetical protein
VKEIANSTTQQKLKEIYDDSSLQDLTLSPEELHYSVFVKKRAEVYVEKIMKELQPKFSIVPDTPYKVN